MKILYNISLYASTSAENFSNLINLIIKDLFFIIFNVLFIVISVIAIYFLIKNGLKIFKEKDPNARQKYIKRLGYWFLALVVVGAAALVLNVILPILI